jgi:arylsulfatase A-like enzyme
MNQAGRLTASEVPPAAKRPAWESMMKHLGWLAAVYCVWIGTSAQAAEPARPNFVFILMDDMGWRDLGCFGSTFFETPHIDRLAAAGMKITNAYAACPVCSPTRASIMTGRYPPRYNVTDWLPGRKDMPSQKLLRPQIAQQLALDEITIARALKPAGYVSASIGKWHLGGPDYLPDKHGFDVNVGGTQTGSPPGGYFKFKTPTMTARDENEYLTDRLTDEALGFIEKNKDRPFFLYLPHYTVHIPLQAKKDLIAKYEAKAKPGQPQHNPVYAAMIETLDDNVGRLTKKLDELKIADRTVVFFFSDNGGLSVKEGAFTPATSNAPLRAGKGYLYEGGIREPCIVKWPGVIKPGSICDTPVISVDFFPTIMEMAGAKPPADKPIDGVSLTPLLKQAGELKPRELYWHYPHYSNQGGRPSGAVRAGDWKLIEFYEDGKRELYNLNDDIGEQTDLADRMPDRAKELHQKLVEWRKSVNARMPTPNPDYKPPEKP